MEGVLRPADDDPGANGRGVLSSLAHTAQPWLWQSLAALALVLLGGVMGYAFAGPATSSVTLETEPRDATVNIDGSVVAGTSPYARDGLLHGSHTLSVSRNGYREHRDTFSIQAGGAMRLPAVTLERAASPQPAASTDATSRPASGPTDKAATPSLVVALPPSGQTSAEPYTIHLELRGLVPAEAGATAAPSAAAHSQPLLARTVSLTVNDTDAAEELQARAKLIERCEATWQQLVAAEPRSKPGARSRPDAAASEAATKELQRQAARCRWVWRRGVSIERAPGAAPMTTGILRVSSRPSARVLVDGKSVGHTPQLGLELQPGTHTLELVEPASQRTRKASVFIARGRIVTRVENF